MIRLYLLGKKGLACLKNLNAEYLPEIIDVVIGEDKSIQNDYSKEIERLAKSLNIVSSYRGEEKKLDDPCLKIAIGWRWMIKSNKQLLVIHDSLLPKYRGFNPLVTALIRGDKEIGATILEASEQYDRGNIVKQKKIKIDYPLKLEEAIDLMAGLYTELLNDTIADYLNGTLTSLPQDEEKASYSLWRDEQDYIINWNLPAEEIQRFINAVGYPYKGAKTKVKEKWVRIFDVTIEHDVQIANRDVGKVLFKEKGKFTVVCGKGLLGVEEFFDDDGNRLNFEQKFRLRFN